ncbi:hypothetical protein M378DRAFT_391054 [Amanita muscaria Koide BX008]|uniref:Uncharacterized protein n=1 Tax=Amanita muscaria (strain Koide BX008) TaxID=946122 RepID=A0A0C2XC84_AMAMK|nr:hypothetical protein M378DRAFT_391054 [Amanita muscaria Koide BX008]
MAHIHTHITTEKGLCLCQASEQHLLILLLSTNELHEVRLHLSVYRSYRIRKPVRPGLGRRAFGIHPNYRPSHSNYNHHQRPWPGVDDSQSCLADLEPTWELGSNNEEVPPSSFPALSRSIPTPPSILTQSQRCVRNDSIDEVVW